jgi:hypothetical protein
MWRFRQLISKDTEMTIFGLVVLEGYLRADIFYLLN